MSIDTYLLEEHSCDFVLSFFKKRCSNNNKNKLCSYDQGFKNSETESKALRSIDLILVHTRPTSIINVWIRLTMLILLPTSFKGAIATIDFIMTILYYVGTEGSYLGYHYLF